MTGRQFEGSPYSAQYIPTEYDGGGFSYATAIIKPPFIGSAALYDLTLSGGVKVEHYATTKSATVILLEVMESGSLQNDNHERRDLLMQDNVAVLVNRLNEIDNGTYQPL